jgi:cell division septation protein DedD
MMKYTVLFLFLLAAVLVTGCSDDKKEEAARLEQELMGGDTASDTSGKPAQTPDSMEPGMTAPTHEPGAIPSEKQVDLPGQPTGSGYAVQVAGCENADYATYLVGVYKNRGYEPYVTQTSVGGITYYRVRIGLFETMSEANSLKAELQDKFSIAPWIDFVS